MKKYYCGQAIKVMVTTKKKIVKNNDQALDDRIVSNYNMTIKNIFLVSGYLESEGVLYKFSKVLTSEELKMVISDALNDENLEINDMKFNNKLAYSYFADDKIKANFSGVSVMVTKKNNEV